MQQLVGERPDRMEEACGVFAVLAAEQPVANLVIGKTFRTCKKNLMKSFDKLASSQLQGRFETLILNYMVQ